MVLVKLKHVFLQSITIHQTYYEKAEWLRVFNHHEIACEACTINAMSAVNVASVMLSSKSAWFPNALKKM